MKLRFDWDKGLVDDDDKPSSGAPVVETVADKMARVRAAKGNKAPDPPSDPPSDPAGDPPTAA